MNLFNTVHAHLDENGQVVGHDGNGNHNQNEEHIEHSEQLQHTEYVQHNSSSFWHHLSEGHTAHVVIFGGGLVASIILFIYGVYEKRKLKKKKIENPS